MKLFSKKPKTERKNRSPLSQKSGTGGLHSANVSQGGVSNDPQLYRPASRANMGIAYKKFLDLLEEVEIHVIDMLYPDSDEEKSEKSAQELAAC
jgi:hypothetical protein